MLIKYHNNCRICGNEIKPILDFGEHYLHGSFIYKNYNPPIRKIPFKLAFCDPHEFGCGLLQSSYSLSPILLYNKYGYRSGINEKMRNHLNSIVNDIMRVHTNVINVLDIASNDGFLLSCYPEEIKKVGVDPCDAGLNSKINIKNYEFINNIYPCNDKLNYKKFDVITCIAMFYDLNDPKNVARNIKTNLSEDGICVIEVSYWPDKMDKNAIDEVCQEHVCFYSLSTLENIFNYVGFKIFRAIKNNSNGGSIQLWLTHKENNKYDKLEWLEEINNIKIDEFEKRIDDIDVYDDFVDRVNHLLSEIRKFLINIEKLNKTVHLYGASTKGNVLLQCLGKPSEIIKYAAERNEEKFNGYILGSGIKMISEQESKNMQPDYYFCPIWAFKKEVLIREKEYIMNGGSFIFPIPTLEIVDKNNYEKTLKECN